MQALPYIGGYKRSIWLFTDLSRYSKSCLDNRIRHGVQQVFQLRGFCPSFRVNDLICGASSKVRLKKPGSFVHSAVHARFHVLWSLHESCGVFGGCVPGPEIHKAQCADDVEVEFEEVAWADDGSVQVLGLCTQP